MSNGMRGLVLVVGVWVLVGAPAVAQSPTLDALIDQVIRLKKQLELEKARSEEAQAVARSIAEEARAQRVQAEQAEERARAEARRADAAREELERAKRGDLPRPGTEPKVPDEMIKRLTALAEEARARVAAEEAHLAEIKGKVPPDSPLLAARVERVAVARKLAEEAAARVAELGKRAGSPDTREAVEQIRREHETERRELLRKLELETVRGLAERERALAAEVEKLVLTERLKRLEMRLAELEKQLREKPPGEKPPGEKPPGENPPGDTIEGKVVKIDGGLLALSLGSDAGLRAGHTLELFRLGEKPTYLGTVRIVNVEPRQSVAQPVGKLQIAPQVGDSVSSKLGGK